MHYDELQWALYYSRAWWVPRFLRRALSGLHHMSESYKLSFAETTDILVKLRKDHAALVEYSNGYNRLKEDHKKALEQIEALSSTIAGLRRDLANAKAEHNYIHGKLTELSEQMSTLIDECF